MDSSVPGPLEVWPGYLPITNYGGADKFLARPNWKKKQLKGRRFLSDAEVIAAAETWLDGQLFEFFWVAYRSYRVWSL